MELFFRCKLKKNWDLIVSLKDAGERTRLGKSTEASGWRPGVCRLDLSIQSAVKPSTCQTRFGVSLKRYEPWSKLLM